MTTKQTQPAKTIEQLPQATKKLSKKALARLEAARLQQRIARREYLKSLGW
jgi:hypothetical protein